jgi:aminoglycoside 2''-phosphotransferase
VTCGLAQEGERAGYLDDLLRARKDVFPLLAGNVRYDVESQLEAFLDDDANFTNAPTLLHAELWPEHVLFSRASGRLAGVIDFGDVSIGDPDYDLAFLASKLGKDFIARLLRHHPHSAPARLAEKIRSFFLFNAIDDVFTGFDRGDRPLVDSALVDLTEQSQSVFRIGGP